MSATTHAKIVAALADSHEDRLLGILDTLESDIVGLVSTAPVQNNKLFDLQWAIQSRQELLNVFRRTYLTEADSIVREYDNVINSYADLFGEYNRPFEIRDEVVIGLKTVAFNGFQDIALTFHDQLANELYQYSLVGKPVAESIKAVQQKINGVYIESDKDEINRLVEIAKGEGEEAEEAVEALHRVYAADRTGNNMRRYARQMVHDSIMQFDAGIAVASSKEAGIENFEYFGTVVNDSRDWCVRHIGKIYNLDEMRVEWEENDWKGKAAGDPMIVRGGYNCRHHWIPAFED